MSKELRNTFWGLFMLLSFPVAYGVLWSCVVFIGHVPKDPLAPLYIFKALEWPWPTWFIYSVIGSLGSALAMIVLNPFSEEPGDYGNAAWAKEKDIKKMGLREESGVILGAYGGAFLRFRQALSILLVAPPGSGKTQGIIVPNLLSCPNSVMVHDPKRELYYKTGPRRSEFSKVVMFAPAEEDSCGWNPLSKEELPDGWADIQVIVTRLAATLFPMPDNGDSIWADNARAIFTFWSLYNIHKHGETSIPDVLKAAIDGDPQELIAEALGITYDDETGEPSEPDGTLPERVRLEGRSLMTAPERQFGGYIGNFKSGLSIFLDERVKKNLSYSSFCLKDLRKERTSLYICIKNSDQTRIRTILNIFFETSILTFLDKEPDKDEMSITYFMDEMMRLGRLEEMLNAPAISRSYRCNSIFVWQSFEQITKLYGSTGVGLFKGCCAYHLYFAPNEDPVAEAISRSIGPKTRKRKSASSKVGEIFGGSISESWEGVPLIRPQEIMSLSSDKIIVMAQNHYNRPIMAKVPYWYKDKTMKAMIPAEEDQGPLFADDEKPAEPETEKVPELETALPASPPRVEETENPGSEELTAEDPAPVEEPTEETEAGSDEADDQEIEVALTENETEKQEQEESEDTEDEIVFWGDDEEVGPPGFCDGCGKACESENDIGNSCDDDECEGTFVPLDEE